ncbi:MAG: LamG-like jellyroll fold domain-containing protein, partial [Planctomycetota bacterium]
TFEFWVSTSSKRGFSSVLISKFDGSNSPLLFEIDGDVIGVGVQAASFNQKTRSGKAKDDVHTVINDGRWHHVAAVKLARRVLLFVDGKLEGQLNGVPSIATKSPWKAGNHIQGDGATARLCRIRVSRSARYLLPFTPEKHYVPDKDTSFTR